MNKGLKFKYLSFNNIEKEYKGISVFLNGEEIAYGFVNEVLKTLSAHEKKYEIPNYIIKNTRIYYDIFVIELMDEGDQNEKTT